MTESATRRVLFVHAHPDDETITTGGTIAVAARSGAEVTVLTCSLGEEGEVIGEEWAGLVADRSDQLGGYRIHELSCALAELGCSKPRFLGGAGRWRDSGMVGTPAADHPRAFVRADRDEAVGAMVAVIRDLRPHVVVAYDPVGGYGHPDHQQVHLVASAAFDASGDPAAFVGVGQAWAPSKMYWTVTGAAQLADGLTDLGEYPAQWTFPQPGELPSVPDADVTTSIDVRSAGEAKRAALRAHATQVTLASGGRAYALSNNVVQPVFEDEQYILVRGNLGDTDADGRESDLFSGIG
ncbi:1D-myo-inositol 2-acetamido-2-deoxy-alpha-D-glucopyranoside deacetylase [Rhodococcoides trifolii]|uniref:1D-myo-inositol 2-acetamido-2-deoxy-alpha-D-glucopyranoside deacetylase n=1 Tax=Rhodococcoides trifolii TaxID=908250 RepID=A0A917FZ94_9NOCA|nr:N-acetyl-1-D-myo-inositol-2-amino-2-deoxy-alpha-D-glucopyranoside deacetylase [Rhodococcus trifolii]GGG15003.1 1D-myo-inositol 2-acetamido-2-deoxy-alpha-D-glucopyranoside deacetylase [Rhodococcus trifolii]